MPPVQSDVPTLFPQGGLALAMRRGDTAALNTLLLPPRGLALVLRRGDTAALECKTSLRLRRVLCNHVVCFRWGRRLTVLTHHGVCLLCARASVRHVLQLLADGGQHGGRRRQGRLRRRRIKARAFRFGVCRSNRRRAYVQLSAAVLAALPSLDDALP